MAIDSNVDSDAVQTYIGTDNYAAGQMAAQAALDGVEGSLQVGIVNYDVSSANGQEREQGAVEAFSRAGASTGSPSSTRWLRPGRPRRTRRH